MERNNQNITMTAFELSQLRSLAVKEYNRKINRKKPKNVRAAEWAMEVSGDHQILVELGKHLDDAFGNPPRAGRVE